MSKDRNSVERRHLDDASEAACDAAIAAIRSAKRETTTTNASLELVRAEAYLDLAVTLYDLSGEAYDA